MAGVISSPDSHLSWLRALFPLRDDAGPVGVHMRSVAHSVSMTVTGRHAVRWIRRGREQTWTEVSGTVHFRPCTGDWQDFVIDSAESGDVLAFLIPADNVEEIAREEELKGGVECKRLLLSHDPVLQQAMLTLSACHASPGEDAGRADEAARRLVLRLVELTGGGKPAWHDDTSVFDRRTLGAVVEYIDAHLMRAPSLSELGGRMGLSPSHFARKFRRSTGWSLQRFVNRRRVRASLDLLRDRSQHVRGVALDLGFSSQSHFTRLFSDLTGMTPAKYRKQFRRCGRMPVPDSRTRNACIGRG